MYSDRFLLNTFVSATLLLHGAPLLAETADERLESLDQKVRVLERKLELSEEDAAAKAKQQAGVNVGDTGVAIKSADGNFELRFRGYVQGGGAVLDNTVLYAVGVFNGVADGASSTTDANDRKDVAARLFFQPWYN